MLPCVSILFSVMYVNVNSCKFSSLSVAMQSMLDQTLLLTSYLCHQRVPELETILYGFQSRSLRGGLCFSCQTNLNEKRRTQRKHKSDGLPVGSGSGNGSRSRFNDQVVELNPNAVIS